MPEFDPAWAGTEMDPSTWGQGPNSPSSSYGNPMPMESTMPTLAQPQGSQPQAQQFPASMLANTGGPQAAPGFLDVNAQSQAIARAMQQATGFDPNQMDAEGRPIGSMGIQRGMADRYQAARAQNFNPFQAQAFAGAPNALDLAGGGARHNPIQGQQLFDLIQSLADPGRSMGGRDAYAQSFANPGKQTQNFGGLSGGSTGFGGNFGSPQAFDQGGMVFGGGAGGPMGQGNPFTGGGGMGGFLPQLLNLLGYGGAMGGQGFNQMRGRSQQPQSSMFSQAFMNRRPSFLGRGQNPFFSRFQ